MALNAPFVRWIYDETSCCTNEHGGHYYFIPTRGRRILAAVSVRLGVQILFYRVHHRFIHRYGAVLNVGEPREWLGYADFATWLTAMVHNSFVRFSASGVPRCWFLKRLWEHDVRDYMVVPLGFRPYLPTAGTGIWILLKHGSRVWPIRVLNDRFQNGWRLFCRAHMLQYGFKLVLACERKWIFNVMILDQQDHEIIYNWSFGRNPFWQTYHPAPEILPTACWPSVIEATTPLTTVGITRGPGTNYLLEFEQILEEVMFDYNLQNIEVTMGNRRWILSATADMQINEEMFDNFIQSLELQNLDYMLIMVMPNFIVKIVILDAMGSCEKLYEWF